MKMNLIGKYLNCESTVGVKDPSKTYYFVLLMQGTDTIKLTCNSELFEEVKIFKPMQDINVELSYNSTYKSLKLIGLV